ncbi:MAG: LysR family transcriptional regulator, partial [Actinomycetota bacterium]|nr:LysR family transcriptional regulator [Actinomycetota bacterium]
ARTAHESGRRTACQPIASADVAGAVADVSAGAPLQGTRAIAGPEVFALDELGKITLAARGDHRSVVTDSSAGMLAAAAAGDALTAKDGAVIAKTTYREWLAR